MNSPSSEEAELATNGPVSEVTQLRRKAVGPQLAADELQYYLFKPRSSRHPLLRSAYELWRDGWQETLSELEGITKIHSDEFARQDEIGVLCVGQRCVSVAGLRWLDLSHVMAREDSYFQQWPEAVVQQLGTCVVGIPSNLVIHSEWRGTLIELSRGHGGLSTPLALATLALAIQRFIDSPAESFIGVARNDRAMNRMATAIGGTKIGQTIVHGIHSDLIRITRASAVPRGPVVDALWCNRDQE